MDRISKDSDVLNNPCILIPCLDELFIRPLISRRCCKTRKILGADYRRSRTISVLLAIRTPRIVRVKSSSSVYRNIYSLSLFAYFPFRINPRRSEAIIVPEKLLHYGEQARSDRQTSFTRFPRSISLINCFLR